MSRETIAEGEDLSQSHSHPGLQKLGSAHVKAEDLNLSRFATLSDPNKYRVFNELETTFGNLKITNPVILAEAQTLYLKKGAQGTPVGFLVFLAARIHDYPLNIDTVLAQLNKNVTSKHLWTERRLTRTFYKFVRIFELKCTFVENPNTMRELLAVCDNYNLREVFHEIKRTYDLVLPQVRQISTKRSKVVLAAVAYHFLAIKCATGFTQAQAAGLFRTSSISLMNTYDLLVDNNIIEPNLDEIGLAKKSVAPKPSVESPPPANLLNKFGNYDSSTPRPESIPQPTPDPQVQQIKVPVHALRNSGGTHYRSRIDIIATILKVIESTVSAGATQVTKTRLMQGAFLSYDQIQQYIEIILGSGLIQVVTSVSRNTTESYQITPKGSEFLKLYVKITELVGPIFG